MVGELVPEHDQPVARRDMRVSDDDRRAVVDELRIHTYIWLVLSAFFVVLYAGVASVAESDVPFWPIFPIAGIGLTVGIHAAVRRGLDH